MNRNSAYQANGHVIGWINNDTWAVAISARSTEYLFTGTQDECEEFAAKENQSALTNMFDRLNA